MSAPGGESELAVKAPRQGFCGVGKGDEQRVSLGLDVDAAVRGEGRSEKPLVNVEQRRVGLALLAEQAGGALDVGHNEGDHARRKG